MKVNADIERIENGFIVTTVANGLYSKSYYRTLREFINMTIGEMMDDQDLMFKEHETEGEKRTLQFSFTDVTTVGRS